MESDHFITDRQGVVYRVRSDRDEYGWSFYLWHAEEVIGHMYCIQQPPTLMVGDFKLHDDVRVAESIAQRAWRKLLGRPEPVFSYRQRGLGTAMLVLLADLAKSAGFGRLDGWISDVDTDRNPDLPDWYRRRGFIVTLVGGKSSHQIATISKEL